MPSCNGASMVFITRRRVAFKSDASLRGTVSFLLQVISPRFCGMFSNYFPSVSREKTLLSCCTTRSMAKGVTERTRKYVYFNFRRRREFSFYFAKYMWFGLAFVPGHVPCGRRICFVSACHVSHELLSALPHQHDVRCCVALCSKSSLFMFCGAVIVIRELRLW